MIGPVAMWKLSSTGGAGLDSVTTVVPISSVPAGMSAATAGADADIGVIGARATDSKDGLIASALTTRRPPQRRGSSAN